MALHWLSPDLEAVSGHPQKGSGVFARRAIPRGSLLVVWGGEVMERAALDALPPRRRGHSLQVEEGLFLVTSPESEPADLFNHSCAPNAGLRGPVALEALRDLAPGEEVCFDYAMSDGSDYDEFPCACGAAECRGRVTGEDWSLPALQRRYAGHFSPYLQRRIDGARPR